MLSQASEYCISLLTFQPQHPLCTECSFLTGANTSENFRGSSFSTYLVFVRSLAATYLPFYGPVLVRPEIRFPSLHISHFDIADWA